MIKSAYRKIALAHHPDRSKHPRSAEIFMAATDAYDVLSDPQARLRYDEARAASAKAAAAKADAERAASQRAASAAATAAREAAAKAASASGQSKTQTGWVSAGQFRSDPMTIAADIQHLTTIYARGQHDEAKKLAEGLIQVAPRHAVPYAVLGGIARFRGNIPEALKMYAYAVQFEPGNRLFQQRYEELLKESQRAESYPQSTPFSADDRRVLAPLAGGFMVLIAAGYVFFSHEAAVFSHLSIVSTWTAGLPIMLFLSGIAVGASLSMGNLLDRFASLITPGGVRPPVALGVVAIANLWAAVLIYLMIGVFLRKFNATTSRILFGAVAALLAVSLGAAHAGMDFGQSMLWGGNLVYFGALAGWLVADAFRAL